MSILLLSANEIKDALKCKINFQQLFTAESKIKRGRHFRNITFMVDQSCSKNPTGIFA